MPVPIISNPLISELIGSVSGLAYCSNQKRQRMWKACSRQPVVSVLHDGPRSHGVSWIRGKQRVLDTISAASSESLRGKIPELCQEHKSWALSPRCTLGLTLCVLNISWQLNKPRQLITGAHSPPPPTRLQDPETG